MVPFICCLNYSFPWARGYLWDERRLLQVPRVPQVAKYRPTSFQVSFLPSTGPRHHALSQTRKSNQASHLPQPAILTLCTGAATWGKDHHVPHTKTAGCVPSTWPLPYLCRGLLQVQGSMGQESSHRAEIGRRLEASGRQGALDG